MYYPGEGMLFDSFLLQTVKHGDPLQIERCFMECFAVNLGKKKFQIMINKSKSSY